MDEPSQCLGDNFIVQLARGDVVGDAAAEAVKHLDSCASCSRRYQDAVSHPAFPAIPGYTIVGELGRGRFGVVYKAWRSADDERWVALKALNPGTQEEQGRFEREIRVLRGLDCPNIVKCIDHGKTGGLHYYAMELVSGAAMDEYLRSPGRTLLDKLRVFKRVCDAVSGAHAKGVVHRDLKPGNVIVTEAGEPYIVDFGLSAVSEGQWTTSVRTPNTATGSVLGTVKYMSPEQASGKCGVMIDHRSDIWSLGIILYEIATGGDYPFDTRETATAPAQEALLQRIRSELPRRPRIRCDHRPGDLARIIERCLQHDPHRRIDSAAKLANDIAAYIDRRPIQTKSLSVLHRTERTATTVCMKARTLLWAAGTILVALALVWMYLFHSRWEVAGADYLESTRTRQGVAAELLADDFVIVEVNDATVDRLVSFAQEHSIPGVAEAAPSWRILHGYLMQRLAGTKARVIVWDYCFQNEEDHDEALVAGLQALSEASIPVVLTVHDPNRTDGIPRLSPKITHEMPHTVHYGLAMGRDIKYYVCEIVVAWHRGGEEPWSGVALSAVAACFHPQARLSLEWNGVDQTMYLAYETASQGYLRERDPFQLSKRLPHTKNELDIHIGDNVGYKTIELHTAQAWKPCRRPYESLLAYSDEELCAAVDGKIVVIGDARENPSESPDNPDIHEVTFSDGATARVPGCHIVADTIANLLQNRYMQPPNLRSAGVMLLMTIVACMLGLLIPLSWVGHALFHRRRTRACTIAVLAVASGAMIWLMVNSLSWMTVHLSMIGAAFFMAAAVSCFIEFSRRRLYRGVS